jgi:DNA-binding transcriptional MocR family regulator
MKTMWCPAISHSELPRYQAIADALGEDVRKGVLAAGTRLPTMRALAETLGVTLGTVHRAYGLAEKRGLISREVGRGSFIRADGHSNSGADKEDLLDLTLNRPPDIRVEETLRRALIEMGRDADLSGMLDYGESQGQPRHRRILARWLAHHGADFDAENLIVTSGAQQALTVTLAALSQPGDRLIVEELTYPGIKSLARIFGLRIEAVALDEGGLRPDSLAQHLAEDRGRVFLYCMPNAQNPTTATLDAGRRKEIAKLASDHGVIIIEDDVSPRYTRHSLPPLATLYPERSIYISSLSKTMAPGLRIGALAAPSELLADLLAAAQTTNWMAPPLMAELACRWIEDGTADVLEQERNRVITRLKAIAETALFGLGCRDAPDNPNLWLPLGERWQGVDVAGMAKSRGILVAPAENFAINGGAVKPALRLSLTETREDKLTHGLNLLASLIAEGPGPLSFKM